MPEDVAAAGVVGADEPRVAERAVSDGKHSPLVGYNIARMTETLGRARKLILPAQFPGLGVIGPDQKGFLVLRSRNPPYPPDDEGEFSFGVHGNGRVVETCPDERTILPQELPCVGVIGLDEEVIESGTALSSNEDPLAVGCDGQSTTEGCMN